MTDEGRLEIDEHGQVLDGAGATAVLDLADPGSTEELAPRHVQRWVDSTAAPFLSHHRSAVRAVAVVSAAVLAVGAWWATRPPYVAPVLAVDIASVATPGSPVVGPVVDDTGVLRVAYLARSQHDDDVVHVQALTGPGLRDATVTAAPLTGSDRGRVDVAAAVDCSDPGVAAAKPTSYRLTATATTSSGDVVEGEIPLAGKGIAVAPSGARLDAAVIDWCLAHVAPDAVAIESVTSRPLPDTTLAEVSLAVRNTSPIPLTLATARHEGTSLDVDLSPAVTVAPGEIGTLTTQTAVQDCGVAPGLSRLAVLPSAYGDPSAAGITLTLAVDGRQTTASYAIPDGAALAGRLGARACAGATGVAVGLDRLDAITSTGSSWSADAVLDLRSDGVGIWIGRLDFVGGPSGAGSQRAGTVTVDASTGKALRTAELDGGAGRLTVTLGGRCTDVGAPPSPLPVRVTMPDQHSVPYVVPFDDVRVSRAAHEACGAGFDPASAAALGWR